jgi:hypothetical protein
VPEDDDFWDCKEEFRGGDSSTSVPETVEDSVNVVEVLPDEESDAGVFRNGLVSSSRGFITRSRAADSDVV